MLNIPDGLPTLAIGCHDVGEGRACVMEYVSILAGEGFSDHPTCTHPHLAEVAREINDGLDDKNRHLLVPLIGRLFGTSETNDEIDAALCDALPIVEGCNCFTCKMAIQIAIDPEAEDMVELLSHLIDVYDEASGRTGHRKLSAKELLELAKAVAPAA